MAEQHPAQGDRSKSHSGKFAIVTPYFREERSLLERCLRSVRNQTVETEHLVISDGIPQSWLDHEPVRHLKLDRSHADFGNTPRGIGGLLLAAEGYEGIGFLDADNWLEADHIEKCLKAGYPADAPPADIVLAQRHLRRPDETIIPILDEPVTRHVDTNCFFFLAGAIHVVPRFAMIPPELSIVGDRLFYISLKSMGLRSSVVPTKTVNYHCLWASVYQKIAEAPPPGAKPDPEAAPVMQWLKTLSPSQRDIITRRTGLTLPNYG